MIAARTFSDKSTVNLKKDDLVMDNWKEILDSSCHFLKEKGVIANLTTSDLYRSKLNEKQVSHLIRHTDAIPKKTKGIYIALGAQNYYLNIWNGDELEKPKLKYILKLIFNEVVKYKLIEDITSFCQNISYSKSYMVFDLSEHIFNQPKFDEEMEEIIRSLILD